MATVWPLPAVADGSLYASWRSAGPQPLGAPVEKGRPIEFTRMSDMHRKSSPAVGWPHTDCRDRAPSGLADCEAACLTRGAAPTEGAAENIAPANSKAVTPITDLNRMHHSFRVEDCCGPWIEKERSWCSYLRLLLDPL